MKKYNIAHFGAFDIDSFGDSLFAEIFRNEIGKRIDINSITLFSVVERVNAYNNNGHVHSYNEFEEMHNKMNFDAVVIGGGEMLHFKPISFKGKNDEKELVYPPGHLWITPIQKAIKNNIPILFNGVGIPYSFSENQHKILENYLPHISYMSVRDQYSKGRICENILNKESVRCVPDSVFLIDRYYDAKKVLDVKKDLFNRINLNSNKPYIVLQYGTSYKLEELVQQLNKIKENYKYDVVLLPINHCHEDLVALEKIKDQLQNKVTLISDKLNPDEIISIIANAVMFLGTSLHGNLVASVYGVKCISLDMYKSFVSKIDGLFNLLNLEESIVPEPEGIYNTFKKALDNSIYKEHISERVSVLQKQVSNHFDEMARIIEGSKGINNITLVEKSFDSILESKNEKYMKSYVLNKLNDNYIQTISSINEGTYTFKFEFEGDINIQSLEWNICSDCPKKIRILKCISNDNNIKMKPMNPYNVEDFYDTFVEYNMKYSFINSYICSNLIIQCEILNFTDDMNVELLRNHNNNSQAHIELLLQSERDLQARVFEIENKLKNREQELNNEIDSLKTQINSLEVQINSLEVQINNKNGHIELLLESDRELERIKNSRSWRLMGYVWKFRDKLVPFCSKRRLLIKIGVKFVKHPIKFIKKLTPKRIAKFWYYLKREGISSVSTRLDECVVGGSNQTLNLNINKVDNIDNKVYRVSDFEKLVFPLVENPQVSIIIPVYNQIHYTYVCLKSILQNSKDVNYEVIIANDCSTDVTTDLDKFVENITVITTKENLRFLRNCNNAAKYAKGQYILFLNNDTQVQENWLRPLITLIEKDDSIGMVGSKLVYPDGRLQEAGGIIWDDASGWNYGRLSNPQDPEFSYVKECDYISGASMMIKHSLWKEIGGFDERFAPAYYEDSDLAFEVRKHGYKVMLQPLSIVVHFEGISNGTDLTSGQKAYQVKNCETFKEKWKNELKDQFKNGENVFVARDRSRYKKHILVVDHYVPHYDKDAGGKCTYMYMKLFVSLGMKVTFIGDNFYPHQPYTSELQQMGVEVLHGNYYCNNWKKWLEDNGKVFDYAYLNRPHISEKYIDLIRKYTDAKIIYFGHDLHYLREYREYEITGDKAKLKSSNEWKEKEFNLFRKADAIHVVGSYEEGILKKEFKDKSIHNIPVYIYDSIRDDVNKNFMERENIIFVGGFGHPPNTDAVFWFAEKIFPSILEKYPHIIWYIVGSKPSEKVQGLASKNIVVTGFISDEELANLYEKSRMAVVPLRIGAGVKGKVVEALYNQVPLVTTPIGAEGLSLQENAFVVAETEQEFINNVIELYENFDRLKEISDNSIEFIHKHFTYETAKKVVLSDIDIK